MTSAAAAPAPAAAPLGYGDAIPWFECATLKHPAFHIAALGGKVMLLAFFGSLSDPQALAAYRQVLARRAVFDDVDAMMFAFSTDPQDRAAGRLADSMPGVRWFLDFDGAVGAQFGVDYDLPGSPRFFVVDEALRVTGRATIDSAAELLDGFSAGLRAHRQSWSSQTAPVLTLSRLFEQELCGALIAHYDEIGGKPSGFMRDEAGLTVGRHDPSVKRRRDVMIQDDRLKAAIHRRIKERLAPMMGRAFGWTPTRIERYLVACYDEQDAGFFRPHRDNTNSATQHRKFAVSINLNGDFEGGDLRFPEFGPRTYRPPPGGATVFACGLLHEATPVTRGRRYAVLPFLYDNKDAEIRAATRDLIIDAAAPEESGETDRR